MGSVPPRSSVVAAGYGLLAVADTALAARGTTAARRARWVTKPLLMPVLAAALAGATPGDRSRLRNATLAAQALSTAGDVALLREGERPFLAGLGSFFGAHLAYVAAFASAGRPWRDRDGTAGVRLALGMLTAVAPPMSRAAGRKAPRLRAPVAVYGAALAAMFATSTRLSADLPSDVRSTIVAGTSSFLVSDVLLGLREFLRTDAGPQADAAVMATYTLGQGLIAIGVAKVIRAQAPRTSVERRRYSAPTFAPY